MKAFSFEGKGFEYFKIWIVNILLTIVTLGLYYPWAKVRNRRYFYANSNLEGRNFEYHATGKQLFIGYLISIVLLIIYVGIQNVSPAGSLIILGLFFIAFPWIIWRSLKFNMRVTSFSNVLFSFEGNLGAAYFNYMLLPFLFFLSLYVVPIALAIAVPKYADVSGGSIGFIGGLLIFLAVIGGLILALYMYSLMTKKMTSYVINFTRYGQGKFSTDLAVGPFVKITLKTVGLMIGGSIIYMIIVGLIAAATGATGMLMGLVGNLEDPSALEETFQSPIIFVLIGLVYLGLILIGFLAFAYSTSRKRAYIYDNTKLDNKITFTSTLGARKLAWVSITNLLMIAFTLGLATPWAAVRMARLYLDNTHADISVGLDEYVTQKQEEQSSLGEQIGDAFDVDAGVGF